MKVADVMAREVEFVTIHATVWEVSRLIFGRSINGVPVCQDKKVVGFITERDILNQFYPSMKDLMEDPVHSSDFEQMEGRTAEILSTRVDKIMSKSPTVVTEDTPLLRAQSLMFVNKVGRLPVVDQKGHLVGIVTKGDIFQGIVGKYLHDDDEEGFYDWVARRYDTMYDWEKRLSAEIPDLLKVFKTEKVEKILDVGSSTGEHVIKLGIEGYDSWGLETSSLINKIAQEKRNKLPESIRYKIKFVKGKYEHTARLLPSDFHVAMFLGNALSHVLSSHKNILKDIAKKMDAKKAMFIFQISNSQKVLKNNKGLREFVVRKSPLPYEQEHAFLRFYTKGSGEILSSLAMFDFAGGKWGFSGMHSTSIQPVGEKEILSMLKSIGFSKIKTYGGYSYGPLFKEPFNEDTSDWLNVIAKRG